MKVVPVSTKNQNEFSTKGSTKTTATEAQRKEVQQLNHEDIQEHKSSVKHANSFDTCLLGIAIVIGGQVFSWNGSLSAGFWEAFTGLVLTGSAYICLIFCMAEMTSALPFSGGSYGFVRVCIGPFFGYVIGCCEALQNMAYVASSVIPFGQILTLALNTPETYEPIWWAVFFVSAIGINVIGGKTFWTFTRMIGLTSLFLILIYIGATAQYGDFQLNAQASISNYHFNGLNFITYLPLSSWYFIGVESLPLVCTECQNPQKQLPIGMVSCILILFVTAVAVFFTATSQSPGTDEVAAALLPFNFGYQRVFNLSDQAVAWLAVPATYATGFGFMFVYGRQMCSMARSGLFPDIFKARTNFSKTPYMALIVGSLLSLVALLTIYYTNLNLLTDLFNICILASYSVYISVFISYFIFVKRYSALTKEFRNPLGYFAPIYGISVYSMGLISVIGYQSSTQIPLIFVVIYLIVFIAYYFFYGYKEQKLSEEEQKILFRAYVINANGMKRGKHRNSNKGGKSVVSTKSATESVVGDLSNNNARRNAVDNSAVPEIEKGEASNKFRMFKITSVVPAPEEKKQTASSTDHLSRAASPIQEQIETVSKKAAHHLSPRSPETLNLRRSITEGMSERITEIAEEIKFLPLMKAKSRAEYEELVIADVTGQYPEEKEVTIRQLQLPPLQQQSQQYEEVEQNPNQLQDLEMGCTD